MTQRITNQTVHNPQMLRKVLEALDAEIDAVRSLINELRTDHGTFKTVVDDIKSTLQGDYILTTPTLAIGSTATNVSNVAFNYVINGVPYAKAAVAAGTAPGNDVIPQSTYGACAFDIGTNGTIDAIEAADNATGYASAALAAAGIPAVAADHARMGYVTVTKSDGAFTFGTTDLDAANVTAAYTNGDSLFAAISESSPATITAAAVTEQVEHGT